MEKSRKMVDRQEFDEPNIQPESVELGHTLEKKESMVTTWSDEDSESEEETIDKSKKGNKIKRRFHSDGAKHGHRYQAIQAELGESRETLVVVDTDTESSSPVPPCIFKTPFPGLQFQEPQLVSIGPYHCNKNLPLQKFKYSLLDGFISRTKHKGIDLRFYVQWMTSLELHIRSRYSEDLPMSSSELVEMMLLDSCFIMETLAYFAGDGVSKDYVFPIEPWQLPILVRDLLILENQIPFFVLRKFEFDLSVSQEGTLNHFLPTTALKFFDLAFSRSSELGSKFTHLEPKHLLDLFLQSIHPSDPIDFHMETMVIPKFVYSFLKSSNARNQSWTSMRDHYEPQCDPPPPFYLTKNVKELQASGIKFWPGITARFTDIGFNNGVLEIPFVTIDDLFIAILINGVAFEYCDKSSSPKHLSAYVSFMSRIIRHPSDADLLYSNGIISRFSHNDQKVVESFHMLRMNILDLDFQHSYLSERLKELERYYYKRQGNTRWQRHMSRYWRICFFCLTGLLFGFNHLRSVVNWMIYIVQEVKLNGMYADFQGDTICSQHHSSFICDAVFGIAQNLYNSARGRVKSVDLSPSKFMALFVLNVIIVNITVLVCKFPAPNLAVVEQSDIEVEDSVTVYEHNPEVEDSVTVYEHNPEVEDTVTVYEHDPEVQDSITVNEMIVDCVSEDTEEYYNEPWRRILEDKWVRMLISALTING